MGKRSRIAYRQMAIVGERFNVELHDRHAPLIQNYLTNGNSYFATALSFALQWTYYASLDNAFLDYAVPWFDSEDPINEILIENLSGRWGAEKLIEEMRGLRFYKNAISISVPDFRTCDVSSIRSFQLQCIDRYIRMRNNGQISGLGSWLLYGPFKIVLIVENRLWADSTIDDIVLPTGSSVDKGIKRFHDEFPVLCDFDIGLLEREDGPSEELVHAWFREIGSLAQTRVIHVNSAFYQYGRKEMDF